MSDPTFTEIAQGVWIYRPADGPNAGAVIGSDGVVLIDCPGDEAEAEAFADRLRAVTPHPVKYAVVTHYHASRWTGLGAFPQANLIATRKCNTAMLYRGGFEPRAAALRAENRIEADIVTGRDAPNVALTFKTALSINLGDRKVDILHFGPGHTTGDAVVWVQDADAMFVGDLVEREIAPFIGDASFDEWIEALDKLAQYRPLALIPGRGAPTLAKDEGREAIIAQREFVDGMWRIGSAAASHGRPMLAVLDALEREAPASWLTLPEWRGRAPFAAARIHDAANGLLIPQIWTPERVETLQNEVEAALS